MKKLLSFIAFLITAISGVLAHNNAMYIYRSDGIINAFLKSDIDSIRYSQLDNDSVFHNEYVVQEVWAVDSIYRIPLEVIDSVSFITPETVYQPGTIAISAEMRDFIISSDSLQLTFASNTPKYLLPNVGDKLVNTEASGGLLSGFIGLVRNVENSYYGYIVDCDPLSVTDVFECYYGIISDDKPTEYKANTRGILDGTYFSDDTWSPGKMTLDLFSTHSTVISYDNDDNLLIPSLDKAECSVSLTPTIRTIAYLIVNKEYGVNLSVSILGDYTLEEYMALSGSITGGDDVKLFDKVLYRFPHALSDLTFEAGVFLRGSVNVATEQKWTQKYRSVFHWELNSNGNQSLNNENKIWNTDNLHSGIIALKGAYETGVYANINIELIATSDFDIAKAGVRLEGGLHFDGTAIPFVSNKRDALKSPDLYNMMKGQGVDMSAYYGTSFETKLFSWGTSTAIPNIAGIPFGNKMVLKSCYYVPEFTDTKLEKSEDNSYFASMNISGDCVATDMGFSLQNKNNSEDCINSYCVSDYKGDGALASVTFYNKPSQKPYVLYPLVKFGELEMIAEPSADMEIDFPKITEFKQTGCSYSKGGYYDQILVYDYKFDVATTIEMESLEGVEDWGYVVEDPSNNVERISLMEFGTSYTDTCHSYYCNDAKSTACLYGYVKYAGDSLYYDDEPEEYPLEYVISHCPDNHHPHAIDLGLPSGTKWSCCNVGAWTPEEFLECGEYFAWGETLNKYYFSGSTYKYYDSEFNLTKYTVDNNNGTVDYKTVLELGDDAAHAQWGGSWRMPTEAEFDELDSVCIWIWTNQNGANGYKVVSQTNGNCIFLPARGWGKNGGWYSDGGVGCYWSSSLVEDSSNYAWDFFTLDSYSHWARSLYFDSDSHGMCYYSRSLGLSVRPVCP